MVSLANYVGREQAFVKHVFLERYLEALIFKTASAFNHIVYVDGFAGPWRSSNEQFEDTSFGIALHALRRVKDSMKGAGRIVKMTALLVEKNSKAYGRLATIPTRFPDITIKTYPNDFVSLVPEIMKDIPNDAFAFFFIDPKGWDIPLLKLQPMLARSKSEVTFNWMFEFINRAANMTGADTVACLDDLMPYGNWRKRLAAARDADERKEILIEAFTENLKRVGNYAYVVPTEVLRPLKNRTLYCLFYATRHETGLKAFRDCQTKALDAQVDTRAALKLQAETSGSGQTEMFTSLHDMGPSEAAALLSSAKRDAEAMVLELTPRAPDHIAYKNLWTAVLTKHAVRLADVNSMCAAMKKRDELVFLDWEPRARVPKDAYRMQRPDLHADSHVLAQTSG
jgi:three-Cys-motif partner protein